MKIVKCSMLLFFMTASFFCFSQKQTTIEAIVDNPGRFLEESVTVEGIVTQFVPVNSSTNAHFLLEGKYGGVIKVKTDEGEPIQNKSYRVTGTVYSDNGRPFIHERSKTCLDCETQTTPIVETPKVIEQSNNTLLFIIIGASILLIIIIVFFVLKNKQTTSAASNERSSSNTVTTDTNSNVTTPSPRQDYTSEQDDFKTIKFSMADSDPKTMKFIPGKLELITGDDKGKTFRIAGYPTVDGSIVTIGRRPIKGDRSFAHILIDPKFQTVSGLQAELIYRDGKLYVKNHSTTNPTQVDGIVIDQNKIVELKKGSIIRAGELEFKYVI